MPRWTGDVLERWLHPTPVRGPEFAIQPCRKMREREREREHMHILHNWIKLDYSGVLVIMTDIQGEVWPQLKGTITPEQPRSVW